MDEKINFDSIFSFLYFQKDQAKRFSVIYFLELQKMRPFTDYIRTITYSTVLIFGFFISVEILNLDKVVISILAVAGDIGLALGFAFHKVA